MKYAVALDIGGTKIEGVLFDASYRQIKKKRVNFAKNKADSSVKISRQEVLDMISDLIVELKQGRKISGIGISIPDIITKDGAISGGSKIKCLSDFAIAAYFRKKFRCRVEAANDADCFALGEAKAGAAKNCKNVVGVIWGTGVGAGIVIDGKRFSGTTGSAGEFGHNVIDPNGPKERTGLRGTVEGFAGGPNIIRNYKKQDGRMKSPDILDLYKSEEPAAKKAMDSAIEHLSIGLASLMNIINPDIIFIGGGLSNLPVYAQLNKRTRKYAFSAIKKSVKIVKNKLGDSAGVYGAAALVLD